MRTTRIESKQVWRRISVELARYAHGIPTAPPREIDWQSFALAPRITFGGSSQAPLVLSEAEAHAQWHNQFHQPDAENNWMPPVPVVDFNRFDSPPFTRPRLEDFLPISGSEEPEFILIEESQERQERGLPLDECLPQLNVGDAIEVTGSLQTEIELALLPQCVLDAACKFDEIERNARMRLGSDFGRHRVSIREYVVTALLDLRAAFEYVWPNLPNDACASFWQSWQVHDYVAKLCWRLTYSNANKSALNEAAASPSRSLRRGPSRLPLTRKGDVSLLKNMDGSMRTSVTFQVAEKYLAMTARRRQQLAQSGALKTVGRGQNVRVLVVSLLDYLPAVTQCEAMRSDTK